MRDARALVRLHDILHEIEGIRSVTDDLSFDEFDRSWSALRAVQHGLLIIGEAVKNSPDGIKASQPEIPWSCIGALGNFLRHEYATIDNRRIWDVVENHLGRLETAVRSLLKAETGNPKVGR